MNIKKMKNVKSGGKDGITAEILKADIHTTVEWLANLFKSNLGQKRST